MEREKNVKQIDILKILKIVGSVVFYLIIFFIFLVSIANIRAGKKEDAMPNIFGRGYLTVASNSMEGSQSDSFNQNDMIVVKNLNTDKSRESASKELKVGDIITFYDKSLQTNKKLNSHRIVLINKDSSGNVTTIYTMGDRYAEGTMKSLYYKGEYSITKFEETFGDLTNSYNAQMVDQFLSGGNLQEVGVSDLRGVYIKTISGGGKVEGFIKQYGNVVILLPLFLFLAFEIYMFSRNVIAYKKAKYEDTHADEIQAKKDEERRKLKEELMKELLEEQKKKEENESNQE